MHTTLRALLTIMVALALAVTATWFFHDRLAAQEEGLKGKKVVMIVPHSNFRDEELFEPERLLKGAGVEVTIASSSLSPARGMLGGTAISTLLTSEVNANDYDAVILIGGTGATEYWDDPVTQGLVKEAAKKGRIVAAICLAPVTLARAGVLKGRSATVTPSAAKQLEEGGARYTDKPVERDGLIITASGPSAASGFARTILRALRRQGN